MSRPAAATMEVEFTGELTGRRFRYDVMRPLEAAGQPGATLAGHHQGVDVESGEPVYVRAVAGLTEFDVDDIRRVRHAISVARTPAVVSCATIVLRVYVDHYNRERPHRALELRPPERVPAWWPHPRVLPSRRLTTRHE